MSGFDRDDFWKKILSMYSEARENNYLLKLNEEQVRELKALFIQLYIPMENLSHYNENALMRKMMTKLVSIYKLDKDTVSNYGEIVELVNSVNYDGRNLYIHYARVSPLKMRRFELGKTLKQVAERVGCSVTTVKNLEENYCDLTRQPENLIYKFSKALECSPEDFI